uniref:Uncharacterized protein n=1 Tax=Arundo donax TaxID=35708 RepID=A0A0A8Z9B4_ARUDO
MQGITTDWKGETRKQKKHTNTMVIRCPCRFKLS